MQASIVVLSALVAVAASQYYPGFMPYAGVLPMNPYLGVPLDTPEVMAAKRFHLAEHARVALRDHGILYRKRRDAPAPEAEAAAPETAVPAEGNEAQPAKRQLFNPYFRTISPLGWASPYYSYGYAPYSPLLFRKRRDTTNVEAAKETAAPEANKEKRQILTYSAWPYGWGSYVTPYSGLYHPFASPYLLRKRRDTESAAAAPETKEPTAPEAGAPREKRQFFGYSAITPYAAYAGYAPYAAAYSPYSYTMPYYAW